MGMIGNEYSWIVWSGSVSREGVVNYVLGMICLFSTAHDIVDISLIHDDTTLRAASLGTQLRAQVINIDFAIAESLHGLQAIPRKKMLVIWIYDTEAS